MPFATHEKLMEAINNDLTLVMDEVGQKIQDLVKYYVDEVVYKPYGSLVRLYQRQEEDGGFLGSWTYDLLYDESGNTMLKIYSDPEMMVLGPEKFAGQGQPLNHIHGRPNGQDTGLFGAEFDRRNDLDMMIAEGIGNDFNMSDNASTYLGDGIDNWWLEPRDYLTPTLDELEVGKLSGFVRFAMSQNGMFLK